jgi:hypothetical protein
MDYLYGVPVKALNPDEATEPVTNRDRFVQLKHPTVTSLEE